MKTIYDPTVYLLNHQVIDESELDRFLGDHEISGWDTDTEVGAEKTIEVGGRLCYMSFAKPRPGGNSAYIKHIKEVGHGSVLEHAVWTIIVSGVSRSFSHELVRHRAGFAYSQLSQRYVDESVCEVVVPEALREEVILAEGYESWMVGYESTSGVEAFTREAVEAYFDNHPDHDREMVEAGADWLKSMRQASSHYQNLTRYLTDKQEKQRTKRKATPDLTTPPTQEEKTAMRKEARQAARSVLPNATETKVEVTANARAFRHFIEMRASKFAEPEIRKVAFAVWKLLNKQAPNLFGDYTPTELSDGTFALDTPYRKV
jgi:thymidylate synthase (FAD)